MLPSVSEIFDTVTEMDALFGRIKGKLLNNPDEASAKLSEVLNELGLILDFVEKETVSYLEIIFLPDKSNFMEFRSTLLSLESGYVSIKGYEARGHCHKIMNIYHKHLDKWFSKVLDQQEADDVKHLFERMDTEDTDMISSIDEITRWLQEESEEILQVLDGDQLDIANDKIKQARVDIQSTRRDVVNALAQLKLLQASFIASAQTV